MIGRRPTSMDVAAAAGVSQPTVSRALRGAGSVSAETRDRVLSTARALNYTLDQRAARLRSGSTGNLALVMLVAPGRPRSSINPLYFALLGAVAAAASERGYNLLVSFQDGDHRTDFGQAREADGTVVIGSADATTGWAAFRRAADRGEAVVAWGAPDDRLATVRCDNRAGAALAVRRLAEGGRRRIALICPHWERHQAYAERRAGYHDALRALGLPAIEAPDAEAPDREAQGHAAARALLDGTPPPDAIFAACDHLALGALRALRERGLAVPGDVALAGFDGIPAAAQVTPALTTVEQDAEAAGRLLVDALLEVVAGRPPAARTAPMRLVVRASG